MGRQQAGQWRPVNSSAAPTTQYSRPSAPVGEPFPPKPEARSNDLFKILPSYSLDSQLSTPPKESLTPTRHEPEKDAAPEAPRKLIASIPEEVLTALRSTCAAKAEVSLLGRIQGKHPGLKALKAWARDNLHPSLSLLSLKSNNLFEVTFAQPEGRIHALTQADLVCDTAAISFSSWRPHFDSTSPQAEESLDHPVWVQIVNLCQVLREDFFLKIIGEQIGHVILIDNSEAYRAKLFGPRIRLLVRNLHQLPQTVVIPRLDGEGTVEYQLEFSGLPKQCGRCRALDHLVRNCPKKAPPVRQKEGPTKSRDPDRGSDPTKIPEQAGLQQTKKDALPILTQEATQDSSLASNTVPTDRPETQEPPPSPNKMKPLPNNSIGSGEEVSQHRSNLNETTCTPTEEDSAKTSESPTGFKMLKPDDINFPKLQTPASATRRTQDQQTPDSSSKNQKPKFVWQSTQIALPARKPTEGGRGKDKHLESTPLTRQGYRSGRLAEDFWSALGTPNTPSTNPKMLRVIPFLTKNRHTQAEYLVDTRSQSFGAIAHVHVAEVLAGIPWTQSRARQHVVNEVSQVLHKSLVFNNNLSNPFQKWAQGNWYAQWKQGSDGEFICTLFLSIDVPEQKVKPRKGLHLTWRKEPPEVSTLLAERETDEIQAVDPDYPHWTKMAGRLPEKTTEPAPPESHNRFASLLESEAALE